MIELTIRHEIFAAHSNLTAALMHGKINPYVLRFRPAITLKAAFSVAWNFYPGVYAG